MCSGNGDGSRSRVLILDDEPLIVMDIEFTLNDAGYATCTATTAEKAMSLACEHRISAAILDIDLGHGATSFGVADYCVDRHIPFLFHSASLKTYQDRIDGYAAGSVAKPCEEPDMVAAVRVMLK